jgi:putative transposase
MKEIKKGEGSLEVEEQEGNEVMRQLSDAERGRLKTVKELLAVKELPDYGRREEAAAKKLNLSKRSMKRLVKGMNEVGSMSVIRQVRSDKGNTKISKEWEEFIVKTYQEGNRGSTQISPAQVAVRVRSLAKIT